MQNETLLCRSLRLGQADTIFNPMVGKMLICFTLPIPIPMRTDTSPTIYRKDYTPPGYWVNAVEMGFDLDPSATRVAMRMTLTRNAASSERELMLYGEELELVQLRLNGKPVSKRDYRLEKGILCISTQQDEITLEIETLIRPDSNTSLMGLYV